MRAITYPRYGGPEVTELTVQPKPTPSPEQVLVRVVAGGLNPVDALLRQDGLQKIAPMKFPQIAGNEFSGVVESVGSAVTRFKPGDSVFARSDKFEQGAFAEFVAISQDFVAAAPSSLPLMEAAAVPLAGLTAQQTLGAAHLDVGPGDRLLVTGGAGGVGLFAIQLAKIAGAHVTTTASPAGEQLVHDMGADAVINYREQEVSESGLRFTKVLDLVGAEAVDDVMGSVEPGGRIVSVSGPPTPGSITDGMPAVKRSLVTAALTLTSRGIRKRARQAGLTYEFYLMSPDGAGLQHLAEQIDAGQVTVTVDGRYAMEDFKAAFQRLESRRAKGKVLLDIGGIG